MKTVVCPPLPEGYAPVLKMKGNAFQIVDSASMQIFIIINIMVVKLQEVPHRQPNKQKRGHSQTNILTDITQIYIGYRMQVYGRLMSSIDEQLGRPYCRGSQTFPVRGPFQQYQTHHDSHLHKPSENVLISNGEYTFQGLTTAERAIT